MKKGRMKRNFFSFLIGVIVSIALIYIRITPDKISNYVAVISGVLSFASLATGFLFASFSLIPSLPNSKLMKALRQLKTDKKLLDRLLITIMGFIFSSIFSIIALCFKSSETLWYSTIVLVVLFGSFSFSVTDLIKVLRILLRALEEM
ncbi:MULTISPECIES: hypothetical protein [unclassified Lactobacillus]|uniref:hypothetical protein n=1 Tax=unclassified Lactobacillus TaxID=2620435 RepID=UPI00226A3D8D|nr:MULTISPECIES: hypothetical protein [unclassified Lactobacillus]